jgi:stress-induced morphogen
MGWKIMSVSSSRKQTKETKRVEQLLREEFPKSEAYRYNAGTIRVRVIDERFEGKSLKERDQMVSPLLAQLPEEVEQEIMMLLMLTPDETKPYPMNSQTWANREFEDPSNSSLQ